MKNEDELSKLLKNVSDLTGRMKSFAEFHNRISTVDPTKKGFYPKLKDEYEEYFYSLTDDGWEMELEDKPDFVGMVYLRKKGILKKDAEEFFNNLLIELRATKNRMVSRGFDCHFMIWFNEEGQQDLNPKTHKNDDYKFKGIGKDIQYSYSPCTYDQEKKFEAKIKFLFV